MSWVITSSRWKSLSPLIPERVPAGNRQPIGALEACLATFRYFLRLDWRCHQCPNSWIEYGTAKG